MILEEENISEFKNKDLLKENNIIQDKIINTKLFRAISLCVFYEKVTWAQLQKAGQSSNFIQKLQIDEQNVVFHI